MIPALNEAPSIGDVLDAIPDWVDQVVVADNGSTDDTATIAAGRGATVVDAPRRGYGSACLSGIRALHPCDIVVFLDADYSDYPNQMNRLVDPIAEDRADLVIGSRRLGTAAPGALTLPQRFGNALACALIRIFWGVRFTDLGPFRAISYRALQGLGMCDPDYGWTVEMQIKAVLNGIRTAEAPVDYRKRAGRSKISGTVRGVIGAGVKILTTIFAAAAHHYLLRKQPTRRRLVIFTRYPIPGETKTRMIDALGADAAAHLQKEMTEHTVRNARSLMNVELEVRFAGGSLDQMRAWLDPGLRYFEQGEGNLGERMRRAFECSFADGVDQTLIIGTDCPDLSPAVMKSGFDALRRNRVVLGPAVDGGYYLIGLETGSARRALHVLFKDVDWGSALVYDQTASRAAECGVRVERLAMLQDVDRPEDISAWERVQSRASRPRLSVVIPALDEANNISRTLRSLGSVPGVEIIVSDGGSSDDTVSLASEGGAYVVKGPRGRASQMNFGAAYASGVNILFLHADTTLPADFADEVDRVLARPGVVLGAFRFETDDKRPALRWIAFWTNARARIFGRPYGDQGFFLRLDMFRELRGFADIPILEDLLFVRAAARCGRIQIGRLGAVTSARRWRRLGPWRTLMYNQLVIIGYWLGVSPARLAAFYRGASAASQPR